MKKLLLMICLSGFLFGVSAQRKKKDKEKEVMVSLDTVSNQCKDLPVENRPRVTVARFSVSSPRRPDGDFGPNLSTLLTNFLQEVQCFQVLEQLSNLSDIENEINYGKSSSADKSTSITAKSLIANVIVTGEVTRYEVASKSSNIMGVGSKKNTASIGITVKMVDPRTRGIIASRTFSADKETSGGTSVGIGRVHFSNNNEQNPALQWAAEEVIKQAVIFLSGEKDKIPMTGKSSPGKSPVSSAASSTVVVNNIEYSQLSTLAAAIEKIHGVKAVNSDDFDNNKATLVIEHSLKFRELVDKILQNGAVKLSVVNMSKDGATLSVK